MCGPSGQTRDMRTVITGIFLPVWRMRAYTVMDKINVWRGKLWSRPFFWENLLRDDLAARLTDFDLPLPHLFRPGQCAGERPLHVRKFRPQPALRRARRATAILLQVVLQETNTLTDAD